MEIVPATPEQIAVFKKAAAARYAELGVPADVADQLFENQMAKDAADLGLVEKPAACGSKHVKKPKAKKPMAKGAAKPIVGGIEVPEKNRKMLEARRAKMGLKPGEIKKSEVSEKLASVIAESLGRKRKA